MTQLSRSTLARTIALLLMSAPFACAAHATSVPAPVMKDAHGMQIHTLGEDDALDDSAAAPDMTLLASTRILTPALEAQAGRLLARGVPMMVMAGDVHDEDVALARTLGMRLSGHTYLIRAASSDTYVITIAGDESHASIEALARSAMLPADENGCPMSQDPDSPLTPHVKYSICQTTGTNQVKALGSVLLVRSAAQNADSKMVVIKTRSVLTPDPNGIKVGSVKSNLWAAYLPMEYQARHQVRAAQNSNTKVTLTDYGPLSDSRTNFNLSETKRSTFTIGGQAEGAGGGSPLEWLLKLPFQLNASREFVNEETLMSSFQDYSLVAQPSDGTITWRAPINPRFDLSLIVRGTAGLPRLSEARMTPMMHSATMEGFSQWTLPSQYEGAITVTLGHTIQSDGHEWWYDGPNLRDRKAPQTTVNDLDINFEMRSPFLEASPQVLMQAKADKGECLAATGRGSSVGMATCNAKDVNQLWGLDSEGRYRSYGTKLCLSVDPASGRVITENCDLNNNQQWEWRADRLHSRYNTLWRLYVNGTGKPPSIVPDTSMRFDDIPVNVFSAFESPWSSYPSAPAAGDVMPNHKGASPIISPEWVGRYGDVDTRQTWRLISYRIGL